MDASKPPSNSKGSAPDSAEYLYDATLIQVDSLRGGLVFKVDDTIHRVTYPHVSSFSVGAIGRLRLPRPNREFSFNAYPDQRLRRAPASDQPLERRWGWCIGERQFTVEVGVIPGRAGKVIRRDTMPLTLEVPREFANFCAARGITPERVLSTFFADLCNLTNLFGCPREDGYTGSGNAEQALDYFNHTWGDAHHPTLRNKRGTNQRRTRKDT